MVLHAPHVFHIFVRFCVIFVGVNLWSYDESDQLTIKFQFRLQNFSVDTSLIPG